MTSTTAGSFRRAAKPGDNSELTEVDESTTTTTNTFASGKTKKECTIFEPQQWRKTVCKNCFRTQPEHKLTVVKDETYVGPTVMLRRAPDTSNNHVGAPGVETSDLKSGRIGGNAARAAARKLVAGQRSTDESRAQTTNLSDSRRSTSSIGAGGGTYSSASSIDARYIEELENDFFALEDKHEAVIRERDQLTVDLEAKIRTIAELQSTLEQYREKVAQMERKCAHMDEDIKSYRERLRLPESDQTPSPREQQTSSDNQRASPSTNTEGPCPNELQQRLNEVEQLCQEVMEENEQLKEEVEEMQREIEEMHDHFQEDDRDAMRELTRDLEAANKTCRILQFKLRKAERRFEQCEAERANLEERLARLEAELYSEADIAHIRNLEEEIRVAKEVGVRLNNELDILDEKRAFYEEESKQLKDELQASQAGRIAAENELGRLRLEVEKLRLEKGVLEKGPLQVTDKNISRQTAGGHPSLSREASFEEQQLQRDLEASKERETDLSEQLRFADEENRKLKRRMKEALVENDLLAKKLDRLIATQQREAFQYGQQAKQPNQTRPPDPGSASPSASDAQMQSELYSARCQLTLMEEENFELRQKVMSSEWDPTSKEEINVTGRQARGSHPQSLELEHLRSQLNLIQDHLARIEQERERLEGENRRLRHAPSSSLTEDQLAQENCILKDRLKEWDKRLRQVSREVVLFGNVEREHDWMGKYNESLEMIKDQETQIGRMKKRLCELQEEIARLRASERKMEQREKRTRQKLDLSAQLSCETLKNEISSLEEELDEVTADLTAARETSCTAQLRVTYLEDSNAELQDEAERRQRELITYIVNVNCKNQVLTKLLSLLQERVDSMQDELDRTSGAPQSEECMVSSTESNFSSISGTSGDMSDTTITYGNEIESHLRRRIASLEKQIIEERTRVELAESQLERLNRGGDGLSDNVELQFRVRQMDLLKKELEEKDELLETKEEQLSDLKTRIEQSRRMNDALRALMEKDPVGEGQNQPTKSEMSVEVASYRKELESSRKELQILRNNLAQTDKIRERLMKENRELQEELKLREDSIFEQDDEIEKRNVELRAVKMSMESLQKELDQTRRDLSEAKARESSGSSGRLSAQIVQNERIRAELHDTMKELNDIRLKYEESKRALTTSEEKLGQIGSDANQLRNSLQEKDAIIIDLNKRLKLTTEEAGQLKMDGQTARIEKIELENQLAAVTSSLSSKEKECTQLQIRLQELLTRDIERVGSSQDSGIGTPEGSRSRDGTLSRRSAEVDRLRRELSLIRAERDELLNEIKRLRGKLEKRIQQEHTGLKAAEGDLIGLPKGNVYAKALSAQQTTTKINLLNEHIIYLNRVMVELKLQNESLQNHVIDYQRRYRSLKEQYEGEQEAWLTERVVLESKAKEQEDRKVTIANTRQLLQETTLKLCDLESTSKQNYESLKESYEKLEKEKSALEIKLSQLEEHQKLPKVLQRFGASSPSSRTGVLSAAAASRTNSAEHAELCSRLESCERTVAKLRSELVDAKSAATRASHVAVEEAENARRLAEQEAEDLRDRLVTMECYRQQVELFRHRQFETEENAEKEFKIWQEEREHLLFRTEEARAMLEQWYTQLQNRATGDEEVIGEVLKQMDKWRASRGKVPCLKRRMVESIYGHDSNSGSVPASPALTLWRSHPLGSSRTQTQRSTSMEWNSGRLGLVGTPISMNYREGSLGSVNGANLRGSATSLAIGAGSNYSLMVANRCGRSVSPEVTVRKLSNYPDPTPGFLVRPTSRQGSKDSLCSQNDYTQRSFTLPGKPPVRCTMSPARQRFFEEATSPIQIPVSSKPPMFQPPQRQTDNMETSLISSPKVTNTEERTRKSSSQPPSVSREQTRKPVSLSLADRFVKWSTGSSPSSKPKETQNKKADKKLEPEAKSKKRTKSPHSSSETRELRKTSEQPAGSPDVNTPSQTPSKGVRRSGSVSNISPAIMALRQKFIGGTK